MLVLDKTLTTHKGTNGKTLSPKTLGQARGKGTGNDLAKESACDNCNDVSPSSTIIKQAQIGVEARECKVERQEN
ncbi:unnamed protein product [Fusarium graminearum]|nr:unnamed protein product [Fusarium graminearum]VTO90721.1 unnamed protein product [Fusarium graminearum]